MASVQLMTQAEYARHCGRSREAVSRAVKGGRISTIGDKIDPKVADIQWRQNTRARARTKPAPPPADGEQMPLAPSEPAAPPAAAEPPIQRDGDYQVARTRRERAEAERAEMKLQEQQGVLVNAELVKAEFSKQVAAVRDGFLQLPAMLAPELVAEVDLTKVRTRLDIEIRAVLARFTTGDPTT